MEKLPISQCTNQLPTGSQLTLPNISHKITGIKCTLSGTELVHLSGTELVHLSGPETPMCEPVKCSSDVEHNCERPFSIVSGDETDEDHLVCIYMCMLYIPILQIKNFLYLLPLYILHVL